MAVDPSLVERLDSSLETDLQRDGRLGKVKRYLDGDHDLPYMPRGHKREFEHLARRSITNWTPLLSDTFAKGLFVDGYRPEKKTDNASAWRYWQDNGLDARQSIAHRGALDYGTSYALVLPGKKGTDNSPFLRPLSPLKTAAWYRDEDDEYPELALRRRGTTVNGTRLVDVLDAQTVYTYALPKDSSRWTQITADDHGLGVTPFVRFRDRLAGEACGIIRPALTLQDRVNEIVFSTMIALQYASFRQRWATGLAIPEDEDGNPVEPFEAAVNRLWVAEDSEARFGDFAQTELTGHMSMYDSAVKTLAAVSQISPNVLTGDLVNLSAEALAQLQDTTQRKTAEYETLFGESWEQAFRLASLAAGDKEGATDTKASVRWRDTEARSLAQTVDALGKIATMLEVPVEALWDRIPGVDDQEIERWKALKVVDPLDKLTAEIARQTAAVTPAPAQPAPVPEATPTPGA